MYDYTLAQTLIMEMTNYTPWKFEERMKIRDTVKQRNPTHKIVFVIDNFIYGSVSATYLSARIDTL